MSAAPQIANQPGQAHLWDELRAETTWFHILRGDILRGDIARLGANAIAVLLVVKCHSNMKTGVSFPSQTRIAELIGMSTDTVARALDVLIKDGKIRSQKEGRKNVYQVVETVELTKAEDGAPAGQAKEILYAGSQIGDVLESLKAFARNGMLPEGAPFKITLNVNVIHQGDNSVVNINQANVEDSTGASRSFNLPRRSPEAEDAVVKTARVLRDL